MGELRTRKRGKSWEWSFEGAKIDGKRKPISKGGYRTKAEALAAVTQAKAEYDRGGQVFSPSTISLADYLDYWMDNYVKKNLAHNSCIDYESKIRIHIKPRLGALRLASLKPDVIQQWVDDLKEKGMSKSMVANTLCCLSGALNYAVQPCQYIASNPCNYVKIPKIPVNKTQQEKNDYVLPLEDWNRIIKRFEGSHFFLPLMVGFYVGTRLGESYGINLLEDVDFEQGTLTIRHQMQKQNKVWILCNPKYDSFRTVKIGNTLLSALRAEMTARKKNILRYGPYYTKTYVDQNGSITQARADISVSMKEIWPISVKENGELSNPDTFKYCTRVVQNSLCIPLFHSHCLRHTHGTMLAENGASPKTIMERLGHKDIKVTLQTYIFNTEKMQDESVDIFEKAVASAYH